MAQLRKDSIKKIEDHLDQIIASLKVVFINVIRVYQFSSKIEIIVRWKILKLERLIRCFYQSSYEKAKIVK